MSAHMLWYEEVEDDCKYEQTDIIYHNIHFDSPLTACIFKCLFSKSKGGEHLMGGNKVIFFLSLIGG